MRIELHQLECQHPFGPYIHIVMPDNPELIKKLLWSFGLKDLVEQDLSILEKLATPKMPADKCIVYQLFDDVDAWAIIALRAKIDHTFAIRPLFVRVDPECPISGLEVVKAMRLELAKIMIKAL